MYEYEWTCSPYDTANDKYCLPDFGGNSSLFQLTWQDSTPEVAYVYSINSDELNCTGIVTALEFCYTSTIRDPSQRSAFLFLLFNRTSENMFEVLKSIQITATPSSATCMPSDPDRCCEVQEFKVQEQFSLSSPNLAIGFGPRQDSTILQQGFPDGQHPMYTAFSHTTTTSLDLGKTYDLGKSSNQSLRLAWMHIGKRRLFQHSYQHASHKLNVRY